MHYVECEHANQYGGVTLCLCGFCIDEWDPNVGDVHIFDRIGAWFQCAPNTCHYLLYAEGQCASFHYAGCPSGPEESDLLAIMNAAARHGEPIRDYVPVIAPFLRLKRHGHLIDVFNCRGVLIARLAARSGSGKLAMPES